MLESTEKQMVNKESEDDIGDVVETEIMDYIVIRDISEEIPIVEKRG